MQWALTQLLASEGTPFLFFLAAVMFSAWYGGYGPGILALALSILCASYFIEPKGTLFPTNAANVLRLGLFAAVSLMICGLSASRRQVLKAFKREHELLSAMISTAGCPIIVMDRDGRLLEFNAASERITGYLAREIIGERVFERLVPTEQRQQVQAAIAKLAEGVYPDEYEADWLTKTGEHRHIVWSNTVLLSDVSTVRYIIGIGSDITDINQTKSQLQATNQTLQRLIEASPLAIMMVNRRGIVELWNPASERIFGWSAAEAIGQFNPIVPAEKRSESLNIVDATLQGEKIDGLEIARCRKDGSTLDLSVWTAPLLNPDQTSDRLMAILADLSDRKRTEADLRKLQERLTSFFEADLIGITFGDQEGNIEDANDAFLAMIGYTRDELITQGLNIGQLTPSKYRAIDQAHRTEAREHGVCAPYEKEYIRKDGTHVPVLVGDAISGSERKHSVGFILDLTERKQLEQALLRRTEDLAQANRMKDDFFAILSHELRTPLNSILGWSKLLQSRKFDAETTTRALESVERNARLLTRLIDDILDVSRMMRGKLQLQLRPTRLAAVIEAAVYSFRPAAEAKAIELTYQIDPMVGTVNGDFNRLQQIVSNLLSNAIKFTPEHGKVTIILQSVAESVELNLVEIIVADTGKGISSDFQPYVFNRFWQADSSSTRTEGGLGLGLALVRRLVELHGGSVEARSPGVNQGATFTVRLPTIATDELTDSGQLIAGNNHNLAAARATQAGNSVEAEDLLSGLKILVVDDEPDTRSFLKTALERYGATVMLAESSAEAKRLLAPDTLTQNQPDILISDIGMPGEDGYSLLHELRRSQSADQRLMPAIALTAYATQDDLEEALRQGFQRHLAKPVELNYLIDTIVELVGQNDDG